MRISERNLSGNPSRKKKNRRIILLLIPVCLVFGFVAFRFFRQRNGVVVYPSDIIPIATLPDGSMEYFFMQRDESWKRDSLGGSRFTMGSSGCLTSSLTSVFLLQGIEPISDMDSALDPGMVNRIFTDRSVYDSEGNIQWEPLSLVVNKQIVRLGADRVNGKELTGLLEEGIFPVVRVQMPFSEVTHYVTLIGSDGNTFLCMDPLFDKGPRPLSYYGNRIYAVRYIDGREAF